MGSKMIGGGVPPHPLIHVVWLCVLPWSMSSHGFPRKFRVSLQEKEVGVTSRTALPMFSALKYGFSWLLRFLPKVKPEMRETKGG